MRWRNRLPSILRRVDKDVPLNQVHLFTGAQVTAKVDAYDCKEWRCTVLLRVGSCEVQILTRIL